MGFVTLYSKVIYWHKIKLTIFLKVKFELNFYLLYFLCLCDFTIF